MLEWLCLNCKNTWKGDLLTTFGDCPECGSEQVEHGDVIDNWEAYNIDEEIE